MKNIKFYLLAILILSLFIFVLYYPLFDSDPQFKRYITHDFIHSSWPQTNYLLSSLKIKSAHIIHWNQFASAGSPNIAESGIYYLPNYLLEIPYRLNHGFLTLLSFEIYVLAHFLLAGLGMFSLLMGKVKQKWVAIFGAIVFISTGLMLILPWPMYMMAFALIPWIIIALEKYKENKGFFWVCLAAFLAFQQLALCPQVFLYFCVFLIIYWLINEHNLKSLFRLVPFYVLSFLYSAVLLLPLREFEKFAVRHNYISYDYVNTVSTQAQDIFQTFLYPAGHGESCNLFIGVVAVTLIVSLLLSKKNKVDLQLAGMTIFFYLLATNTGLFQSIMRLTPGLSVLRWHSRANEFVILIVVFLLVKAIDRYEFDFKRDLRVAAALIGSAIFYYWLRGSHTTAYNEELSFTLLFGFLFIFILWIRKNGLITHKYMVVIFSTLVLLDLCRIMVLIRPTQFEKFILTRTGNIDQTEWFQSRNISSSGDVGYRIPPDKFADYSYNRFLIDKQYAAGSYSAAGGENSPAMLKSYGTFWNAAIANPNLSKLANINYGNEYYPRSFILGCYRLAKNEDELIYNMTLSDFTGKEYIYLSDDPNQRGLQKVTTPEADCSTKLQPVNSIQNNDQIIFSPVYSEKPVLLFISDNWYPGWNAYVNGKRQNVLKADFTFKAVALPAGNNSVVFKYEPKSYRIGGLVTWISLLLSAVYVVTEKYMMKGSRSENRRA